ncbi:MAG: HAD-IA family hydrolase [Bacteroidales bacterium]|nr:HAD-IA family hydrolase [Bacteroidales bacterium]
MKFKLVLFDLDGTVLDTLQDLGDAVNYAMSMHGFPLHTLDEFRYMVGNGVRKLVRRAMPDEFKADEELHQECLGQFWKYYSDHIIVNTKPYPGIPELIRDLQAKGVIVAIASNKFQEGADTLIHHFYPTIETIVGDRPDVPMKPDPTMVNLILEKYGNSADLRRHTALVGDAVTDIQAAANAGVTGIGVSWGLRPVSALLDLGLDPAMIARDAAHLGELLGL